MHLLVIAAAFIPSIAYVRFIWCCFADTPFFGRYLTTLMERFLLAYAPTFLRRTIVRRIPTKHGTR